MPTKTNKSTKKASKKTRSLEHLNLTPAQKKRLLDPAPMFPEKLAKANEILSKVKNL